MVIRKTFRLALGVSWWTLVVVLASIAEAGTGTLCVLPANNAKKIRHGIVAKVDTRWTDGWGYRPVRVTLSVLKSNRDRTIRVDLMPESYNKFRIPLRVSVDVEIPQGEKEITHTIYLPQQLPWNTFRVEFFEAGRRLDDLSMDYGTGQTAGYNAGSPCLLMVDADAPRIADDRDRLVRTMRDARWRDNNQTFDLPDAEQFQYLTSNAFARTATSAIDVEELERRPRSNDLESLRYVATAPNLEILPPADLPRESLGLAGIDLMIISLEDLAALANSDLAQFRAIDFYIRAGGNLVVYAASDLFGDRLFGRSQDWTDANRASFDTSLVASFSELETKDKDAFERRKASVAAKNLPATKIAHHGLGSIVAIQSADPYEEGVAYWQWVLRTIGQQRLTWSDRHGISLEGSNQDYWDFMIPGFGAAPVKRFLGIIGMFIFLVGPVNFVVLKRVKRLYLLPLTVGLAALVTTVGMLAFALVSDGVSTRVRLRSYTYLDQTPAGNIAATHCRHSYLAAIAPSQGLRFPRQTAVYPILPYYDDRQREETVQPARDVRILGQGYLRSRSTTQFLTTDVRDTDQGLAVVSGEGGHLQSVTNHLGTNVVAGWVRDGQGDLHEATQTADGAVFALQPTDAQAARQRFRSLITAHQLEPPLGLDKGANRTMLGDLGSRRYAYYQRSAPANMSSSILEARLRAAVDFFRSNTPHTYLLVTAEVPPFIATGTRAEQEAGLHVIEGRW